MDEIDEIIEGKEKKFYQKWWFWLIIVVILGIIGAFANDNSSDDETITGKVVNQQDKHVSINDKLDECTKLCAGEDINIPVIKNECYSSCYQTYYYGGEEALDKYLLELQY